MAFVLPVFNLSVAIWHAPAVPPVGGPDVLTAGNLAWGRRVAVPSTGGTGTLGVVLFTMTLLVPAGTNCWGDPSLVTHNVVEVPHGTGRYYRVAVVDDLGKGFANEHRGLILVQALPWPHPIP